MVTKPIPAASRVEETPAAPTERGEMPIPQCPQYAGRASYEDMRSGTFQTDGFRVIVNHQTIAECEDSEVANWIAAQWNHRASSVSKPESGADVPRYGEIGIGTDNGRVYMTNIEYHTCMWTPEQAGRVAQLLVQCADGIDLPRPTPESAPAPTLAEKFADEMIDNLRHNGSRKEFP